MENAKPGVTIRDGFWSGIIGLVREVTIPYQLAVMCDRVPGVAPSYAVRNFEIAAGEREGRFEGMVFQDSDLAKWLEAVGHSLRHHPDPALEKEADRIIGLIAKAQQPDGYVNSYYILNGLENRFTNLRECHELYCLGHMIEAAVAYYQATGKRTLLQVVCRYADLVDSLFGTEPGKTPGYPGHQEIELALVKLYEVTGEERYLRLAAYFLNQRGREPLFFSEEDKRRAAPDHFDYSGGKPGMDYYQSHLPVRRQAVAVGHAVRAVYMYTGMARVAEKTGDAGLLAACRRLWDDIARKQLYITGGIGQTEVGEAFTFGHDLPNDTVYAETCASIGLIFFARAMLDIEPRGEYADVMERALYNTVLAGMARDGKHFFYVNPLEVWPEASRRAPIRKHVLPLRPGWFPCACCPPNVSRLLTSLGDYIYTRREDAVYVNLYIGGTAGFEINGAAVSLTQATGFPWQGAGSIEVAVERPAEFGIGLRLPAWCAGPGVKVNGAPVAIEAENGYCLIRRSWHSGDRIDLDFPMAVRMQRANPAVRADAGKVALTRGPLVYCLEQADNGENLSRLSVDAAAGAAAEAADDLMAGAVAVATRGYEDTAPTDELYFDAEEAARRPARLRWVPYFLWGNRGEGEMCVWARQA